MYVYSVLSLTSQKNPTTCRVTDSYKALKLETPSIKTASFMIICISSHKFVINLRL